MKKAILLAASLSAFGSLTAQNPDVSEQDKQNAALQATNDQGPRSECTVRLQYDTRALSAGRDFGVQQSAFSPSIAYNHKSGFFGALSGFVYSASDPAYNMTDLQLGYGRSFGEHLYLSAAYDRLFFHPSEEGLIDNTFNVFAGCTFGAFNVSAAYNGLFGEETGQRVNLSAGAFVDMSGRAPLRRLDGVFATPNVALTIGNESVPLARFSTRQFQIGTGRPWERRFQGPTQTPPRPDREQPSSNEIAPLCISASLPLVFSEGPFSFRLALVYAHPIPLEGEDYATLSDTFYGSFSIAYTLR